MKVPDFPYAQPKTKKKTGKTYWYYRRAGKYAPLEGVPGDTVFLLSYATAHQRFEGAVPNAAAPEPMTVARAVAAWERSTDVVSLRASTLTSYRSTLRWWVEKYGDALIADVERAHVKRWMEERAEHPNAANNFLRRLRQIFAFAIDEGWITADPTLHVKRYKVSGGHHSWTEEEVATFEAAHPIGTTARLAFALFLYTAQRRIDVVRMRWDAIRGDEIRVKQQKGGRELDIPLHPELAAILSKAPRVATTIITTQRGKPFSPGGVTLGHAMRAWCDAVALPHCSAHGLRKASATRLAEAGCPAHEIMSITGHETLSEVDRYTKAASQKRLARAAMLRIVNKGER